MIWNTFSDNKPDDGQMIWRLRIIPGPQGTVPICIISPKIWDKDSADLPAKELEEIDYWIPLSEINLPEEFKIEWLS